MTKPMKNPPYATGATSGAEAAIEQILLTLDEAGARLRMGHSKLYEELAAGRLQAVRLGRRVMIRGDEITRYIDALPPAEFGRGRAA